MSYNINKQTLKAKLNGGTVCKYWLDSRCKKGDACEYLHERRPDKLPECPHGTNCTKIGICPYKHTKRVIRDCMCYEHGYCKDGKNCKLAHKQKDICLNYLLGLCPDGPHCKFFHLKTPVHTSQDNLVYLTKGKNQN